MDERKVRSQVFYANFYNDQDVLQSTDPVIQQELARSDENGSNYYQFATMTEMVNDFMAAYVGEGMDIPSVKKYKVEYHIQKAIQELSYDVLRAMGSLEYQLDGELSIPLPQDAVKILRVSWVDNAGYLRPIDRRRYSGNPKAYIQQDDGSFAYRVGTDVNDPLDGELIEQTPSETLRRWNERSFNDIDSTFDNYQYGSTINFELYGTYNVSDGRRYGLLPEVTSVNGSYVHDEDDHIIYVDSQLSDRHIVIEYVSDGLYDTDKVRIHKEAEEAVFDYVRWKLIRGSSARTRGEKLDARKDWFNSKRRSKHRLSNINPWELVNTARNMSKIIKH